MIVVANTPILLSKIYFSFSIALVMLFYCRIYGIVLESAENVHIHGKIHGSASSSPYRIVHALACVAVSGLLSYLPFLVVAILALTNYALSVDTVSIIIGVFLPINSIFNPFVYTLFIRKFKQTMSDILKVIYNLLVVTKQLN